MDKFSFLGLEKAAQLCYAVSVEVKRRQPSMLKGIRSSFGVSAALFIVLGLVMFIWPMAMGNILCLLGGLMLIGVGLWKMAGYFRKKEYGVPQRCSFAIGALEAVLGVILMSQPQLVINLVPYLLGVIVLVDSLFKLQLAYSLKKTGFSEWWHYLIMGAVCACAAALMINISLLMSVLLSVTLIVNGAVDLWIALYLSIRLKKLGLI